MVSHALRVLNLDLLYILADKATPSLVVILNAIKVLGTYSQLQTKCK